MKDFSNEMFYISNQKNIDKEVEKLFNYYRTNGYPNYSKDDYSLQQELIKLINFNEFALYNNSIIKQSMIGCGILWTYFPHWIDIECNDSKSLSYYWDNDEKLKLLIKKVYKWKLRQNELHWTDNRIRQCAKVFLAKQSVSNFRPTVAKYIYNKYGNCGKVLDMSSGFGGRLFGFSSSECEEYIGIEPSYKTYIGLIELKKDIQKYINKKISILQTCSEIYMPEYNNYFDLCFTSPPYFNTEKYANEITQSYIKFKTKEEWLDGFLKQTLLNCYQYVKNNRYVIINIANCKEIKDLEEQTVNIAKCCGFLLKDTLYMELSSISKIKGRKYEPIFIFKKEDNL